MSIWQLMATLERIRPLLARLALEMGDLLDDYIDIRHRQEGQKTIIEVYNSAGIKVLEIEIRRNT